MAHPKLPLRIRVDVRDRFEASESSVQKALTTLEEIVGLKCVCNPEWDQLYNALENNFPDKTTLVPTIVDVVVAWCDVLSTRLEDDKFADWTENVITMLERAGRINLRLQVLDIDRPTTSWSNERAVFMVSLPSKSTISPHRVSSGFESDLSSLFTSASSASTESAAAKTKDDDWAEVDETGEEARIKLSTLSIEPVSIETERIPSVATIPTPDILLRTLTPYILQVTQKGSGILFIQGTHSPSLQFLDEYLQRWVRKDHQDTRKCPLLRVKLHESHFGLGINYDTLTIEPYDTYQDRRGVQMNPTIVLALIESVLGYRPLPCVSAGSWEFRRDVAFK